MFGIGLPPPKICVFLSSMDSLKRKIPEYFISKRNTIIQIVFTTVFAFVFINIYKPFGSENWYNATKLQFFIFSGLLVIQGMLVVLISRIILFQVKKRRAVTILGYAVMIALEILVMAAFYTLYEKVILKEQRTFLDLWYVASGNTSLILLIPYLISSLYFAWQDKKQNLEKLIQEKSEDRQRKEYISFSDEKEVLKLTIKTDALYYIESSDNYVIIHYADDQHVKSYLLRNSMKKMEEILQDYPVIRCHRFYMVSARQVKRIRKTGKGYAIEMNMPDNLVIPVTKTYETGVLKLFYAR